LLSDRELSDLSKQVYLTVLEKLCLEHFHIALDLAQNGMLGGCSGPLTSAEV